MIIVDASIWIDHLKVPEPQLGRFLLLEHALMHPHVLGEIALGSIKNREQVLTRLLGLPVPWIAEDGHVLTLIEQNNLHATGIGFTDAHLLASTLLTSGARLWTRDRKLAAQAEKLDVLYPEAVQ